MKRLIGGPGPAGTVSAAGSGTAAAPGIAFASDTNTGIYNPGANQLAISTNGVGRLFVDPSRVLIGTSSAFASLQTNIQGEENIGQIGLRNTNATAGRYWTIGPNDSNNIIVYNQDTNGVYMLNGGTSWTGTSDERLKTGLKPIENALNKVSTLRAVTGRFINDDKNISRSFLIAQDVFAVLPEAVDKTNPEKLGLSYTEVIPLLVAALKESKVRLEALEARLSALESA